MPSGEKARAKPIPNGVHTERSPHSPLDSHNCHAQPEYPTRIGSDGSHGEEDYPPVGMDPSHSTGL